MTSSSLASAKIALIWVRSSFSRCESDSPAVLLAELTATASWKLHGAVNINVFLLLSKKKEKLTLLLSAFTVFYQDSALWYFHSDNTRR